jgi:hypothetical protein
LLPRPVVVRHAGQTPVFPLAALVRGRLGPALLLDAHALFLLAPAPAAEQEEQRA